jgi:cell division protease FtsH
VGALIDSEVSKIMKGAYEKAEQIIIKHRAILDAIAKRLVETETIEREEFENILVANGIPLKKKEGLS